MRLVDLQGHTLMPGFIDPHSHFTACANATMQVDLGEAECFEDVICLIREFIEREQIPAGQWVRASGYDHNRLREGRHPDRTVLGSGCAGTPVDGVAPVRTHGGV